MNLCPIRVLTILYLVCLSKHASNILKAFGILHFLFFFLSFDELLDSKKQGQLDWETRYRIIGGIAQGIQYLHEDSQLRIIHCDLKASSILLDAEMNPKISDFGIARTLEVDQTQRNASKIVGT